MSGAKLVDPEAPALTFCGGYGPVKLADTCVAASYPILVLISYAVFSVPGLSGPSLTWSEGAGIGSG